MKKLLVACLSLVISSVAFVPPRNVYSKPGKATEQLYADDQIIVKLKEGVERFDLPDQIAEEMTPAGRIEREREPGETASRLEIMRLRSGVSVEEAVMRASADPRVEYAEPDYFVYREDTLPNDPYFRDMWGLSSFGCSWCTANQPNASISATRAWDITTGGDDLVVAVLDTGVDLKHPDLAANIWINQLEVAGNGVDDDRNGYIDDVNGWNFYDGSGEVFKAANEDDHGTHVAGTIGAEGNNGLGVTGVAWRVKLMSLKFLGGTKGRGSTSDAVEAINYAIDMKKRGVNIRVINASWGGEGYSQSLRNAIAAAGEAGILFVAAAGNDGEDTDGGEHYPSGHSSELSNVVSVAAMNSANGLATFSNYGHTTVSVAAPGQAIMSTLPGRDYGSYSGTSMAAPFVSGVAALLFSHEPELTADQARRRIVSTSEPTASLVSKVAMSGRADAYRALMNIVAPAQSPKIVKVAISKKDVVIDGFGFANGSSVVEVNGEALSDTSYDGSYSLANGRLTRLSVSLGKKGVKRVFPLNQTVAITIYNRDTGERSAQFMGARQ